MVPHVFMGDAGFGVVHTTRERFAVALFCAEVVIIVIERRMPPCRIAETSRNLPYSGLAASRCRVQLALFDPAYAFLRKFALWTIQLGL